MDRKRPAQKVISDNKPDKKSKELPKQQRDNDPIVDFEDLDNNPIDSNLDIVIDMEEMNRLLRTPSPASMTDEPEIELFYNDKDDIEFQESEHEEEMENTVIQPLLHPSSINQMSKIQDLQQKDEILGQPIPIVKRGEHLATKKQFEGIFNRVDNPHFQPRRAEIELKNTPKPDSNSLLGQTTSERHPRLQHWSMDIVQFPTSRQGQYNYLLTLKDYTTGWFEAYPLKTANSATVKRILLTKFLPRYGPGRKITSDQDRTFVSDIMKVFMQDADLRPVTTIAYNPMVNLVDKVHNELKRKILFLLEQETQEEDRKENRWVEVLPRALWSLRSTPSGVHNLSPYFQVFGIKPYLSSDQFPNAWVEENSQCQEMQQSTRIADTQISTLKLNQNKKQRRKRGELVHYKKGTLVDVWRPYGKDGRLHTLTRNWSGPYMVLEHSYETPYRVRVGPADDSKTWQRPIHVDHLRKRRKFVPPTDQLLPVGWQPVAPPYDLHKSRKLDFRQRLQREIQINQEIDRRYLQKISQPKHGCDLGSGVTPNQSLEELTTQYHLHYPNGFQEEKEDSTDDESEDN